MNTLCAVCSTEAPFKCSGCKNISYCCADHQKKHWKIHKQDCRSYEIKTTENLGRFLCANRDLEIGTSIFSEQPLIFGPKWSINDDEPLVPYLPCVGCFQLCRIGVHKCMGCLWPSCSPTCAKLTDPLYHGIECSILSLGHEPHPEANLKETLDYYRSDAILVLKCILLQKVAPKKWEQLMQMESHEEERKGTPLYEEADDRIVSYLQKNFLEGIRVVERETGKSYLPQSDSKILHKVCGIIEVNFMIIGMANGQEVTGVFPTGCIMEHSCIPNCLYTFEEKKDFRITVKAGQKIKKGDHLKIMYTHMLWGTQMRREHLKETKYFSCACERCSDPTELGTYISALKCIGSDLSSCGGFQLPLNPLDEETEWTCDKCPMKIANEHQNFLVLKMSEDVEELTIRRKGSVRELEKLIDKFEQLLHKNHFHLFALKHSLIQQYGHEPGYMADQLSDKMISNKENMCRDLLKIVEILDPGSIRLSFYTSIILYELHWAIVQLNLRRKDQADVQLFLEAKRHLERSKSIIAIECDSPAGLKLNERICDALSDLKTIFEIHHIKE